MISKISDCTIVTPLIEAWYAIHSHGAGGNCHVVIDDGNIEDGHLLWAEDYCEQEDDPEGAFLMRVFRLLSPTQRVKVLRMSRRHWGNPFSFDCEQEAWFNWFAVKAEFLERFK